MPRINVYVTEALKARMDVADADANWSAVAQRSFEGELRHIENRKELITMTNTVERLSKSKEFYLATLMSKDRDEGRAAGRMWATKHAGYPELKAFSELPDPEDDLIEIEHFTKYLAGIATGDKTLSWSEVKNFWGEYFETYPISDESVFGFIAGATEVWEDLEDQL